MNKYNKTTKSESHSSISGVSGLFKLFKYLNVMAAGMCYEYVYRVESDVWYIPLGIAIAITAFVIADCFGNDR